MIYLTGPLAFGVPCELNTNVEWRLGKKDWEYNNVQNSLRNSDDSPFESFGIEENKFLQYQPLHTWNVANHVRAYLDMIYEERFEELPGMFRTYIDNGKYRRDIFETVYYKCRNLAKFPKINKFMESEFGNAWYSYIDAVHKVAERMTTICGFEDDLEKSAQLSQLIRGTAPHISMEEIKGVTPV